jgi:hypothetical protein
MEMQALLVSGSAFPEQTNLEIEEIQGQYESYFADQVGIGPTKTCELLWAVTRRLDSKLQSIHADCREVFADLVAQKVNTDQDLSSSNKHDVVDEAESTKIAATMHEFWRRIGAELPVCKNEISQAIDNAVSDDEWVAFLTIFGADQEFIAASKSPFELKHRPLIVFSEGSVILPDISSGLDAVWAFYERVARQDPYFYDKKYQRHRASWLEHKARKHLEECFPAECVFSNLSYEDPDVGSGHTAELDILVKWGPFLILCECKSGQFRFEEHVGDVQRLRSDIRSLVEKAFEQSCRARRAIEVSGSVVFRELATDREIKIDRAQLDRLYLCTVSLHNLAGFATRLATLQDLNLFTDNEFPTAFCISDLELICRFSASPEIFLHFIEQRNRLVESDFTLSADDIDLFSAYLDTRLVIADLTPDINNATHLMFSGYSNEFDSYFSFLRGELKEPPTIQLRVPESVSAFLQELRTRSDDSAKYISFALLGLPRNDLAAIGEGLVQLKATAISPGSIARTLLRVVDNKIFCFLNFMDPRIGHAMDRQVGIRTAVEKYRARTPVGIGIGMSHLSAREFECAIWIEGEWGYDEKLEKLLTHDPKLTPSPSDKRPGRNDPCFCGSGKKFKKCCLPGLS